MRLVRLTIRRNRYAKRRMSRNFFGRGSLLEIEKESDVIDFFLVRLADEVDLFRIFFFFFYEFNEISI